MRYQQATVYGVDEARWHDEMPAGVVEQSRVRLQWDAPRCKREGTSVQNTLKCTEVS